MAGNCLLFLISPYLRPQWLDLCWPLRMNSPTIRPFFICSYYVSFEFLFESKKYMYRYIGKRYMYFICHEHMGNTHCTGNRNPNQNSEQWVPCRDADNTSFLATPSVISVVKLKGLFFILLKCNYLFSKTHAFWRLKIGPIRARGCDSCAFCWSCLLIYVGWCYGNYIGVQSSSG